MHASSGGGWVPTFLDLAVEVNGVHGGCDDVGLAVAVGHDPRHLVHQLHGHTWHKRDAKGRVTS